jgi:hypothetical protein
MPQTYLFPPKSLQIWPTPTHPHLKQACIAELLPKETMPFFSLVSFPEPL